MYLFVVGFIITFIIIIIIFIKKKIKYKFLLIIIELQINKPYFNIFTNALLQIKLHINS